MTLPVKWVTTLAISGQTMANTPRIAGTAGDLKSALNALLCTGFNSVTVDSLSRSGTTATATKTGGLGFINDQVIAVSGASQTEWNDEYRVTGGTATTITFTVPGTHTASPTGTIVIKAPPAGFTMTDLGGQLAVFRADDVTGNRLNLWIDDGGATYCRVRGWETWSGGSGTGPFPTDSQVSGGGYAMKRNTSGTTASNYIFFADKSFFYLFIEFYPSSYSGSWSQLLFGDFISWLSPDAYSTLILAPIASESVPSNQNDFWRVVNAAGKYMARDVTLNPSTACSFINAGPSESASYLGNTGYTYPNPLDGGTLIYDPIRVVQSSSIPRGHYPGLAVPLHAAALTTGQILGSFPSKPGRKFFAIKTLQPSSCNVVIDIIGPWR